MRKLFYILCILLWAWPCFGALNAVYSIDSIPSHNACNGTVIECTEITVCQINFYADSVTVWRSTATITPCQINFYANPVNVFYVSGGLDAVLPIEAAPAYNACDGAVTECSEITACQINFCTDPVTVSSSITYVTIIPCQINFYSTVLGNQRKLAQGRTLAQGRVLVGEPMPIKWSGNRNAVILVP